MIKDILEIYPNETVYSWLSRIYESGGYLTRESFIEEIYQSKRSFPDMHLPGPLNDDFLKAAKYIVSFKDLLLKHSLFGYYSKFLDIDRKKRVYKLAMKNRSGIYSYLAIEMNKKDYCVRYCPMCFDDDRKKYGEGYIHIEHQYPRIKICPKHGCHLIPTNLKYGNKNTNFYSLESLKKNTNDFEPAENKLEINFCNYAIEVFQQNFSLKCETKIGDLLSSFLPSKYFYKHKYGRNWKLITNDLNKELSRLNVPEIKWGRVQNIFINKCWNPWDIVFICWFLKIPKNRLIKLKSKKTIEEILAVDSWSNIDSKVFDLLVNVYKGLKENEIRKLTVADLAKLVKIDRLELRRLPKSIALIRTMKDEANKWNFWDERYCLKLDEYIIKNPSSQLSYKEVAKMFGLKNPTLRMFPKLQNKIRGVKEGKAAKNNHYIKNYVHDDLVVAKIFKKIPNSLKRELTSIPATAKYLNISDSHLRNYPRLRLEIKKNRELLKDNFQ